MNKELNIIYWISFCLALISAILLLFFKFSFNITFAFTGIMFLMLMFDCLLLAKKDIHNPIIFDHYTFMAILTLLMTIISFLSVPIHNINLSYTILLLLLMLFLIGTIKVFRFTNMIKYAEYYDDLERYVTHMRKRWKLKCG